MTENQKGIYIEDAALESYAQKVAFEIKPDGAESASRLAFTIKSDLKEISASHDALKRKWQEVAATPGAVRWLLDNHYLARREGLLAAAELSKGVSLRTAGGRSVLMTLCTAFLHSGGCEVTKDRLELFLRGFQKILILNRAELSCLISGLRASLIFELNNACTELAVSGAPDSLEAKFERIFSSLRFLSTADLSKVLERADFIEQTLRQDPAGIYPIMDEQTRAHYRSQVEALSKKRRVSEHRIAKRVLALAKSGEGASSHVGYYLITKPLGDRKKVRRGGLYIAAIVLLALLSSLLFGFSSGNVLAALLLLVPVSELIKSILDFIILRFATPSHMPRLSLKDGIPDEGKTLCVVSAILTGEGDGKTLAGTVLEHRLANMDAGENLLFAVLADFPESQEDPIAGADAWLGAAKAEIDKINTAYGGGFFLLTRSRYRSPEGRYMGRERKRGAIEDLMKFLRDGESPLFCVAGDAEKLKGTRFLLTLDSDTQLNPGSAKELAGAMLHPLNSPVIDSKNRIVKAGHGIITPRIAVDLPSSIKSDFARVFAGQGGADPYCGVCGSVYMDLWESGGYSGKGIIDIDAYLTCMEGRFPENRVLSHDSIEGAYLRGGYMSDTELTDSFPNGALSFYKRLHRWTRGDWQNFPWLFSRGRDLPDIEKWRLFDSLRRSLVPVATFLSIFLSFFTGTQSMIYVAVIAMISCALHLVLTAIETLFHPDSERKIRYHSKVYIGIGGGLVQALIKLILLPVEAYFCLDSIVKALWRMLVSKKNLLLWQTAAQSDSSGSGLAKYFSAMWPASAAGLISLFLSPFIIGKAAGVIWALSPFCAYVLSVGAKPQEYISGGDGDYLLSCAKDIWAYFSNFWNEDGNWLPPDNFQSRPPVGTAYRTSPTNIGLAILSALAAADLGIAQKEEAAELIGRCLGTIEKLKKWNGHLYNWYDTRTLAPLDPPYVSAVDSGNLYACLTAAAQALCQYGRDDLARHVSALMDGMDFTPLYDKSRNLFFIGIDLQSGKMTESWYDLMASEAMLTGYIAIAKGDVPRKHWRRLSRALMQKNGYRGMASWTGTMFEYLMPGLLLPTYRDSLIYESAKFCVYAQRKRTSSIKAPWGASESAFYSLDSSMCYRYKAHGCAALALKRGMDDELVISPYSSFLALGVSPRAAIANLRRLEDLGMRGDYGFWEALDYTKSRRTKGKPSPVRCVMSHHAGMSMISIANALNNGIFQKRFMSDSRMSSHRILLQEKVPVGGPVLHRHTASPHEKPERFHSEIWQERNEGTDFLHPKCCLLSSSLYSLMLTESGHSLPRWGAVSPYVSIPERPGGDKGLNFHLELNGESFSLFPSPSRQNGFSSLFTPEFAEISGKSGGISHCVEAALPAEHTGEIRRIKISNTQAGKQEMALTLCLRTLLAKNDDYVNHPAFYALGLSARTVRGALVIRRLPRGKTGEIFMCIACDRPVSFFCKSGASTGRPGKSIETSDEEYWLNFDTVTCRAELSLEGGAETDLSFALAMAHSEEESVQNAQKMLGIKPEDYANLPAMASMVIGMEAGELGRAWDMLTGLLFQDAPRGESFRREDLWRFGISGDLPIVCARYTDNSLIHQARRLMDRHLLITGCGFDFDLVFITFDGSSYRKPLNTALSDTLWRSGGEALLSARGGVHIVEDSAEVQAIISAAAINVTLSEPDVGRERNTDIDNIMSTNLPRLRKNGEVKYRWNEDASFSFDTKDGLPKRTWSNPLTNGRFGYLAADCGNGNMWFLNARENQISPWLCQPLETKGPESLLVSLGGKLRSVFAAPDDGSCLVTYGFGTAVWEKEALGTKIKSTAFIPPDTDARVFIVECDAPPTGAALHWSLDLVMSTNLKDARYTVTTFRDGAFAAVNSRSMAQARPVLAVFDSPPAQYTCEGLSAQAGAYDGKTGNCENPAFAAVLPLKRTNIIVCGCGELQSLQSLARPENAAAALERTKLFWNERLEVLRLKSGDGDLDHIMNGWAAYQAIACRMMGRCSIYQSGGAFGFRDQLQDAVNLIAFDQALCRKQILRSCERQYLEGDVQHWWHEGDSSIKGVRTRCSDDLLWLPWAVCEYVEKTGDNVICEEKAGYISSPPLRENERDRYEAADGSDRRESVLDHCVRALEMVLSRGTGPHGLLLFGSGDWNDGMDEVSGESQWLTWFFIQTATRFAPILDFGSPGAGKKYREAADRLAGAANAAWDGQWFVRGYFKNGEILGGSECEQCRIDSIAQSFAAFCVQADKDKTRTALSQAMEYLLDRKHGIVRLFTPPFLRSKNHPGYIESYGPGFRENGGQYTHGALWLSMALFRAGRPDEGYEVLKALIPAGKDITTYLGEPYAVAADVYAAPGHEGEAGWTWYTGSAGWLLRIVMEELLGLRLSGGKLYIKPNLPGELDGFAVIFRGRKISVSGGKVMVDGQEYKGGAIDIQ